MNSDTPSTPGSPKGDRPHQDYERAKERGAEEFDAAKRESRRAADTAREAASDFTRQARQKAEEQGEQGKESVAGGLDDFAAAVRKASDELGERDQSMASQLVREVAGGLEQASKTIHGKDIGELTQSVARFARERPTTFLVGAALAGLALGRFARASGEHDAGDYADDRHYARSSGGRDHAPGNPSRMAGSGSVPSDYRSTYVDQPTPMEGAYPSGADPVTGTPRPSAATTAGTGRDTLSGAPRPSTSPSTQPINPNKGGTHER